MSRGHATLGCALAGAAGLAATAGGAFFDAPQALRSLLLAELFWLGVPVGALGLLMLHHLTGGAWGFLLRRILEAALAALFPLALLFVPVLLGAPSLFPWVNAPPGDPRLMQKALYLNLPAFVARSVLYFACWGALSVLLRRWSRRLDRTGAALASARSRTLSGPGLVVLVVTSSFAATDWAMALEPRWYSTVYGMIFISGQALTALTFAIVALVLSPREGTLAPLATPRRLQQLGNLTLTLVMLWAYLQFSQFLITWAGNLPLEIAWYLRRARGSWGGVAIALALFHFGLPFVLLLSREAKRRPRALAALCGFVLALRWLAMVWMIVPAFHPAGFTLHWLDLAATAGCGGAALSAFLWALGRAPLVPWRDPRLPEFLGPQPVPALDER
ncbi:MAG: hypothetical protein KBD01_12485 [Acidobacteria bacterium]|nr:hypothetical protein [Acidobacteriota bacterium]